MFESAISHTLEKIYTLNMLLWKNREFERIVKNKLKWFGINYEYVILTEILRTEI